MQNYSEETKNSSARNENFINAAIPANSQDKEDPSDQ